MRNNKLFHEIIYGILQPQDGNIIETIVNTLYSYNQMLETINNNEKLYIYQNVRCIEIFDQEGFENVCTEDDEIIKCPCCNKIICVESVCCN